jgi:single-stranded-DNA-specific exonuclease
LLRQSKQWKIAPPVGEPELARLPELPALFVQLLNNRNIRDPTAVHSFLTGSYSQPNPFLLKGMDQAVTRLRQAIRAGERIAVYGVEVLSGIGARVEPYIPHRVDEGYGLNLGALRRLYQRGVRLVVTVDCGIRSVDEVKRARQALDLIITDHHSVGRHLPPAYATINPKQDDCPYPFKELAGVGVAFRLAQALLLVQNQTSRSTEVSEPDLLDLVALGTVADLAPLQGENRSLVRGGLEVLNQATRPGVEALLADAVLRRGDAEAIGFRLGPRLNAAGRIDNALLAYRLLTSQDPVETRALARQLGELNRRRQKLTQETVAAAEEQILDDHPDAHLYLAASESFLPGIVGLAASRLTENYYRPSVVVEMGEVTSRGSCRSIPEFHITEALEQCSELLIRFGGHALAAGFTVATEKLSVLRQHLQAIAAERLADMDLRPTLQVDAEIPLEEIGWPTHTLLGQMEPCGVGNPQPILLSRSVQVRNVRATGSERQHLNLVLRDGRGVSWDAIAFGRGDIADQVPGLIDVAYTLAVNEWNRENRLQLNVQDLKGATTPPLAG